MITIVIPKYLAILIVIWVCAKIAELILYAIDYVLKRRFKRRLARFMETQTARKNMDGDSK